LHPPVIKGQRGEIEVRVRNYGPTPRSALPLSLLLDGKPAAPDATIAVGPLPAVTRVTASVQFGSAPSQVLTAQITSGGYKADDRLDTVVQAIDPIKVLVVSGDEREGLFRSEGDFLKLALAPFQDPRRDPTSVQVVPEDSWDDVELDRFQVVILANLERFTASEARRIEQFVYGGGGLLVAPGSLTR